MSYKHFNTYERGSIEILKKLGHSTRSIGAKLGRHHTSISRELKRNEKINEYEAKEAQEQYIARRRQSVSQGKLHLDLAKRIESKLQSTWSPEQIAATETRGEVSFKTIYRWIYSGKLEHVNISILRHKGRRHHLQEKRGRFSIGYTLKERPEEVHERKVFGHWELDTMVSSRGQSKGCFATFIERKSRLYIAYKIPDRTAHSMKKAIMYLHKVVSAKGFKTATTDRGKEFACYAPIEKEIGLRLYFADAYSSWQRGSNENANGLLREFYPKQTDLALVDEEELQVNLKLLHSRPRKCLGWKTPIQVFLEEMLHLT